MITPNDFRNGTTFSRGGVLYMVLGFQHVKPGKGPAFVRAKIQNLRTRAITEETFRTEEKLQEVRIERREMSYLYPEGDTLVLMDNETFEQTPVSRDLFGRLVDLLRENQTVFVDVHEDEVLAVSLPPAVVLEVAETEPGVKGDTATAATKPAKLETGATIQVPLFVNQGDRVKVDTRNFTYIEREKG
ncbi:MAG: elongation factor P [Planctomycetales bacterium 4484_113]|nr:MAG: elongation factor P [Planctomycetales bacterium 4484_113]